jgi:hypothetical protein
MIAREPPQDVIAQCILPAGPAGFAGAGIEASADLLLDEPPVTMMKSWLDREALFQDESRTD